VQPALLETNTETETAHKPVDGLIRKSYGGRVHLRESGLIKGLERSSLPSVVILAAISVALRLQLWMQAVVYPYDAYYYMGTARSLAAGAGYSWGGSPHTRFLPGFPLAFSPFVDALGPEAAAVTVSAIAWGLLGVVCYLTARRLGGWMAGFAAAVMVLFHPVAIEWTTVPMSEGVFALSAYLALSLLIKALIDEDPFALMLAGAPGGYAAITRNEGLALVPIYLGCALWLIRRKSSRASRSGLRNPLTMAGAGLTMLVLPYVLWLFWSSGKTAPQVSYASEISQNFRVGLGSLINGALYYSWTGYRQSFVTTVGYLGLVYLLLKAPRSAVVLGSWIAAMTAIHSLWYFRYDRFVVASIPAIAIAGGVAIGAVGSLGSTHSRRRGRFKRGYLVFGLLMAIVASGLVMAQDGEDLARLHFTLLNRGGGQAIVTASKVGGRLPGVLASNAGAMTAFYSNKQVIYVLPQYSESDLEGLDPKDRPCRKMLACFDPDQIGPGPKEARLQALRSHGVRFVVLQVDDNEPSAVVEALGLPKEFFEVKAIVLSSGASDSGTHRAAILQLLDAPVP
jgi:hypothetical protein